MLAVLLMLAWLPICSAQSDPERVRVQLALAAALQKHASTSTKPPATISVCGKTLYLCDDGTCYCPTPNCKCVDGKCTCGTATKRPPILGSCKCGVNCPCHAGECGDLGCPTAHGPKEGIGDVLAYRIGYNRAISQNKPLLVWVGETCPACEAQWTQFVHCRVSKWDSRITDSPIAEYDGPGVKILKPDGLGGLTTAGTLDGIPTQLAVTSLLQEKQQAVTQQAVQQPQLVFRPMPMMPPPMPMMPMGGFGGGMMMGGGGGCSS